MVDKRFEGHAKEKRCFNRLFGRSAKLRSLTMTPQEAHYLYIPAYGDCFSIATSTGILRRRLPVAAKIAFLTAGTIADVPVSPIPPGGSELGTILTSIEGGS